MRDSKRRYISAELLGVITESFRRETSRLHRRVFSLEDDKCVYAVLFFCVRGRVCVKDTRILRDRERSLSRAGPLIATREANLSEGIIIAARQNYVLA